MSSTLERLTLARTALILSSPFFGVMSVRMRLVEREDIHTLAVDGRNFYYNNDFVAKLSDSELKWGFCHEIMHLVFEHLDRRDGRNPKLWNIACDYAINLIITDAGVGDKPDNILYDEKYRGMSADEIYSLLIQEMRDKGENGGDGESWLDDLVDKIFDEHIEGGSDKDSMTPEERREMRDSIKEAVLSAAKACQDQNAGKLPDCIKRMIDEFDESKVDWKAILRSTLEGMFKNDSSWYRPNKKMMSQGLIYPGLVKQPAININVAIDVSGSISQDIFQTFMNEVNGILTQYADYKLTITCWDTQCHNTKTFDPYSLEDIKEYEAVGGGGTDPECVFEMIENSEDNTADTVIFLTDGYFSLSRDYFDKRVLWTVFGDNKEFSPVFGEVVHLD